VRVWDLETGACVRMLEGRADLVRFVSAMSVLPNGRYAFSAGWDKTVRVWDLETGACVAIACLPSPATAIALSQALGRVIAGTSTGEVLLFDWHGMT